MDRWNELERVGKLRDDGLLSNEEFEALKTKLLKSDVGPVPSSAIKSGNTLSSIFRRPAWLAAALLVVGVIGFAIAAAVWPSASANVDTAWERAGSGDLISCVGHWSYAPSLAQAMDVRVIKRDAVSYDMLIQKVDLRSPGTGRINADNIAMTENTKTVDGAVVDAILHDNDGRGISLQCRSGGGQLTYNGQNIALRQSSKDLKAIIAEKGWRWADAANGKSGEASTDNPDGAVASPQDGKRYMGNCVAGSCSWGRVQSTTVLRADRRGLLKLVNMSGGESRTESSKVTWATKPHNVYVFCSRVLPSVIMRTGSTWQVDVLDLADGVPGILISSATLYGDICHPGDSAFPNDAAALGYQPIPDDRQDAAVNKPDDIFSLAGSAP